MMDRYVLTTNVKSWFLTNLDTGHVAEFFSEATARAVYDCVRDRRQIPDRRAARDMALDRRDHQQRTAGRRLGLV
jgi:hypothetical protein